MASQFLAQDFLHDISFLQMTQILQGRKLLLPLKVVLIANSRDHLSDLIDTPHAPQSISDPHR
jgi:hypothetical protein